MLNICFTADHEFFFGQNFADEEDVFIRPTYQLMELLESFQIPLCLMTDVCSVIRYKELKIPGRYVRLMEEQLRYAVGKGHDVQLHIHPNWLTSHYNNGQWHFDYDKYRLHSFGFGESGAIISANQIITDSKNYLLELLKSVDPNYDCIAFRAGGFCIQPEQKLFEALLAAGIKIDTSVVHGGYVDNSIEFYDFRKLPGKINWWIDPQKGLAFEAEKKENCIFEMGIGSYHYPPMIVLKKLQYKKSRLKLSGPKENMRGSNAADLIRLSRKKRIQQKVQRFFSQPVLFDYDSACAEVLMDQISYFYKHYDCANHEIYMSIIGHPKVLTSTSLAEISKFCELVTSLKKQEVRFIRFRDINIYD